MPCERWYWVPRGVDITERYLFVVWFNRLFWNKGLKKLFQEKVPDSVVTYIFDFTRFLQHSEMFGILDLRKADTFESHKSLNLVFTKIYDPSFDFVCWLCFHEVTSSSIPALFEMNLEASISTSGLSARKDFQLIVRGWVIHIDSQAVHMNEGFIFACHSFLENAGNIFLFLLTLFYSVSDFLKYLLHINIYVFFIKYGHFSINQPLCVSNDLIQIAKFNTAIPGNYTHVSALFHLFLGSDCITALKLPTYMFLLHNSNLPPLPPPPHGPRKKGGGGGGGGGKNFKKMDCHVMLRFFWRFFMMWHRNKISFLC